MKQFPIGGKRDRMRDAAKWEAIMDSFELALNEARAEIQFMRIALEVFYLNVAARAPEPLAMLREMKQDVMKVLERIPVEPQSAQGDQRMKQMTLMLGENFFRRLESHLEEAGLPPSGSPSRTN
jgi:hypothetical protein